MKLRKILRFLLVEKKLLNEIGPSLAFASARIRSLTFFFGFCEKPTFSFVVEYIVIKNKRDQHTHSLVTNEEQNMMVKCFYDWQ